MKAALLALLVGGLSLAPAPMAPQSLRLRMTLNGLPRVQWPTDSTYIGAFRLPAGNGTDSFNDSDAPMAGAVVSNGGCASGQSIVLGGTNSSGTTANKGTFAEVCVPATINDPTSVGLAGLTSGTMAQNFVDLSNGIVNTTWSGGGVRPWSTGVPFGSNFIGASELRYASCNDIPQAFWVSSMTFSNASSATGAYTPNSSTCARIIAGHFMFSVPSGYQTSLGCKVLSGTGAQSIIGSASAGPSVWCIDADTLATQPATSTLITVTALSEYPTGHQRLGAGDWDGSCPTCIATNEVQDGVTVPTYTITDPRHGGSTSYIIAFSQEDWLRGGFFPAGYRTVITTGTKGLTGWCYGDGESSQTTPKPASTGGLGSGSNASTNSAGTQITLPNQNTAQWATDQRFIELDNQTTPNFFTAGGGHPGVARITGSGNSGTATAYVTVTATAAFPGNLTSQVWRVSPDFYCYDPESSDKGTHSYPYVETLYAYDVNDLLSVKTGALQPWQVAPYAEWPLSSSSSIMAFVGPSNSRGRRIISAAWGSSPCPGQSGGSCVYFSTNGADTTGPKPIVHVFKLR